MAGRTGGIWRRLRYRDKWRAAMTALSPDQSVEADQASETRARFSIRGTQLGSMVGLVRTEKKPEPEIVIDVASVFPDVEFAEEKVASPKRKVARKKKRIAS